MIIYSLISRRLLSILVLTFAFIVLSGTVIAGSIADLTQAPVITSVSIPNEPMGLGDEVLVSIYFEPNEESDDFIYVSGGIEGEAFNEGSLQKIDQETYTATITIRENTPNREAGQEIRVRGLQFSVGGEEGEAFDYNIAQDNDPIDTKPPVLEYIHFENAGIHIIGSPINGTVVADGSDYLFDLSRSWINGVSFSSSQVEVTNNADNTYLVSYTPEDGDRDVLGAELVEVELVMLDIAGNRNALPCKSLFADLSPQIDANSARLDSAVVLNAGIYSVGDEVQILAYSSESLKVPNPPLEGTHVNYVPVSSGRVAFGYYTPGIYELSYVVGPDDNFVRSGELVYNLEMEDSRGNRSHSSIPLKNNQVTIIQGVPTATLEGSGYVCKGDSLKASLTLTGESPWQVVIENNYGVYDSLEVDYSPHELWIKSEVTNTFTVRSVLDGTGVSGDCYGEANMGVYYPSNVSIIMDQTSFLTGDSGVELRATRAPGIFTGVGVSGGYFYPGLAGSDESPYSINFQFRNIYGCTSYDSVQVEVKKGNAELVLKSGDEPVSILCSDEGEYQIEVDKKEGTNGSFELRLTNTTTELSGYIVDDDPDDSLAVFKPKGLMGGYDILYNYTIDDKEFSAYTFVSIETIDPLSIVTGPGDVACGNDDPYELEGNLDDSDPLATWTFSGPGVEGDIYTGFVFDPQDPALGTGVQAIKYEYVTEGKCQASTIHEFTIGYIPDVSFGVNSVCIPLDGGEIKFNNTTSGKFSVETWNWDFGDHSSGMDNYSNEEHPVHFYSTPGYKSINLTATTRDGCISYHKMDTLLADKPNVDFTWLNDCYTRGSDITLVNLTDDSYTSLDTLVWTFRTEQGSVLGEIGASPDQDNVDVPFSSVGTYGIELYVSNSSGCDGMNSKLFQLQPVRSVSRSGLNESFDLSDGAWALNSEDGNESWLWGIPDFKGYDGSNTDKAWYTDLPLNEPGYEEQSWIMSPCYDFSDLDRPMIQMDIMKSFTPNESGAVLQYQDVLSEGWKTIGLLDEGLGWYNAPYLSYRPGGSGYGWGLSSINPDTSWMEASHKLDVLAGKKMVKLRIALGTGGETASGNQGFALNNLHIKNRSRKSVIEHFTNSSDLDSREADNLVDAFYQDYRMDVIDLQYHTHYPGNDPMNDNNPAPARTRSGQLGVGQVPYAVLNGGASPLGRYDFSSPEFRPDGEQLMKAALIDDIQFRLDMAVDWTDEGLTTNLGVVCIDGTYDNNIQLYIAIIESEVTSYTGQNGDQSFRNVVLDMLPDPGGKLLGGDWYQGKVVEIGYSWDYEYYIEDVEELGVVAFIQDRDTEEILQATTEHVNSGVGIRKVESEARDLRIFPNPANDFVRVFLGEDVKGRGRIMLRDLSGRSLREWQTEAGQQSYYLDLAGIGQGFYMLSWFEDGRLRGRGKLICGGRIH